ncbi:PP0621 family protein [Pararobbsia alpina]|uniref:Deaminase n=1 Tax=Pararobbsia alpina TaxID=621374 RepID=A0A6S7ATL1_9BURK|nr:PP0621 family protein [Pararobbsia alpina]CAB3777472.1 hypothetical protein LMG28138_00389 [Pararobbsia alpina]
MQRLILLILIGIIANWYWRKLQRLREAAAGRARHEASQAGGRGTANANAASAAGGAQGSKGTAGAKAANRGGHGARLALPEPMVRCAHCDTYLPISEATASLGRNFCGPKHAHDYAVRVAQAGDGR